MSQEARGKPNTTILLQERSNKMTPKDILLYKEISLTLLSLEKLPSEVDGENIETHNWTVGRVRDLGTLGRKWKVSITSFPSELRELWQQRWKYWKSQRG